MTIERSAQESAVVMPSFLLSSRHIGAFLLAALVVLLFPGQGSQTYAAQVQDMPPGTVGHCFDGDTLRFTDRRVVRLAGIDAPELGAPLQKAGYYAREARKLLSATVLRQRVRLLPAGTVHRDNYGRFLAEVLLPDGRSLNDLMIASGAAFFYPHNDLDSRLQERLLAAQQEAIRERRGMWEHVLAQPVAEKTYLGNRQSLRFFPTDCPEAQRIKPRNRVHFGTLMDAFMAGYAPARICPFWPTAHQ